MESYIHICKLFHVLARFLFTISETELDYYHQKVNFKNCITTYRTTYNLRYAGRANVPTQEQKKDLRSIRKFQENRGNTWI